MPDFSGKKLPDSGKKLPESGSQTTKPIWVSGMPKCFLALGWKGFHIQKTKQKLFALRACPSLCFFQWQGFSIIWGNALRAWPSDFFLGVEGLPHSPNIKKIFRASRVPKPVFLSLAGVQHYFGECASGMPK
jgi:hypothetical protein